MEALQLSQSYAPGLRCKVLGESLHYIPTAAKGCVNTNPFKNQNSSGIEKCPCLFTDTIGHVHSIGIAVCRSFTALFDNNRCIPMPPLFPVIRGRQRFHVKRNFSTSEHGLSIIIQQNTLIQLIAPFAHIHLTFFYKFLQLQIQKIAI